MHFNTVEIDWSYLLDRLDHLMDLGEEFLTRKLAEYQFDPNLLASLLAFRWQQDGENGYLQPVVHPDLPEPNDLAGIDPLLQRLRQNTLQFVNGATANHALLWGPCGSGKSSAIKSLLPEFGAAGLRLIEIPPEHLHQLPALAALLRPQPYHFILFCQNMHAPQTPAERWALRNMLGEGLEARPENVLMYATCDRDADTTSATRQSLPEGFGLALGFEAATDESYLAIVKHLADRRGLRVAPASLRSQALAWAESQGKRSGRIARQFIDDLSGRLQLEAHSSN